MRADVFSLIHHHHHHHHHHPRIRIRIRMRTRLHYIIIRTSLEKLCRKRILGVCFPSRTMLEWSGRLYERTGRDYIRTYMHTNIWYYCSVPLTAPRPHRTIIQSGMATRVHHVVWTGGKTVLARRHGRTIRLDKQPSGWIVRFLLAAELPIPLVQNLARPRCLDCVFSLLESHSST